MPGVSPFGIAHRTTASPQRCASLAEAGAAMFEVDVRLAGDRVVVTHFQPVRGAASPVERDGWRFRLATSASRDPDLVEVLAAIPASARVLLDPKEHHTRLDEFRRALARDVGDPPRFVVSTSAPGELERYRAAGFRTWRTIGSEPELTVALAAGSVPEDAVTVRHRLLTDAAVAALLGVAPAVNAWTVNEGARARHLVGLGVSGITTDEVAVLRAVAGS
jgi:glycerophosphoryl diester phosphodiesterase